MIVDIETKTIRTVKLELTEAEAILLCDVLGDLKAGRLFEQYSVLSDALEKAKIT